MKDLISVFCGDISEFMTCHGTVSLSLNPPYHSIRPVAQGGGLGEGSAPPQREIE